MNPTSEVNRVPEVDPSSTRPLTFWDLSSINATNARTAHIWQYLQAWSRLCGMRGRAGTVERRKLVELFVEQDLLQDQPSWAVHWFHYIYKSYNPSEDSENYFEKATSLEKYTLLLEYFNQLLLNERDDDECGLRMLNKERKRVGLRQTLEYGKGRILSDNSEVERRNGMLIETALDYGDWEMTTTGNYVEMEWDAEEDIFSEELGPGQLDYIFEETKEEDDDLVPAVDLMKSEAKVKKPKGGRKGKKSMDVWNSSPFGTLYDPASRQPLVAVTNVQEAGNDKAITLPVEIVQSTIHTPSIWYSRWLLPTPLDYPPVISRAPANLTSQFSLVTKPEAGISNNFHLWSMTRPELCETLPYFRSFQGGVYISKDTQLMGYLLDGCPSSGDIWARDGRFIISHGGGSAGGENSSLNGLESSTKRPKKRSAPRMVPISTVNFRRNVADPDPRDWQSGTNGPTGNPQYSKPRPLEKDQSSDDASIRSLLNAKEKRSPIVLIVGSGYRWWPLSMRRSPKEQGSQAKYVVLGWYLIRDAWEEFEPVLTVYSNAARLFVRWKFAFEWIEAQGKPWWISDLEHATAQVAAPCTFDLQHVPTVNYGLHNLEDSDSPSHSGCDKGEAELFSQSSLFLPGPSMDKQTKEDRIFDHCMYNILAHFRPISPPKPNPPVNHGRSCYHCGKYSPLIYHEGWFCTNSSCSQFCLLPDSRLITFYTLSYSHDFVFKETSLEPRSVLESGLNVHNVLEISTNPWTLMPKSREDLETFRKEHWQGRCCRKCGRLNSKIHWDVWLCAFCDNFLEFAPSKIYHIQDLNAAFKGQGLRTRFTRAITVHTPMDLETEKLHHCSFPDGGHLYILRPAQLDLFDRMFSDFQDQANRRLMFRRSPLKNAYLQGQYTGHFIHNGGVHYNFSCQIGSEPLETGPPIVKEICELLAAASSRILNRTVEFNEVLSCAYKMDQSMNFHSDDEVGVQGVIASVSLGSAARMSFRRKTRKDEPNSGKNTVCLDLILRHGDILIMDGLEIQTNYQHRVVPTGLRFAATARTILHDGRTMSKRRWKRDSMKVPDVINC